MAGQYELVFSLQAEAQKFVAGMNTVAAAGKRVSEVQAELEGRGIRTTRAFSDELRAIERLSKEYGNDRLIAGQLAEQKKRLLSEIQQLERATTTLTAAEIRLNNAGRLTNATTGRFISTANAQIALREQLNALGIRTTEQLEEEFQMLQMLETAYANDATVMEQLAARRQMLQGRTSQLTGGNRQLEQSLYSLGFIINDSAQFSYGLGAGLRSVANNIQPLIFQLSAAKLSLAGLKSALMGPAGVIIAFNLVTTAAILFGDKLKKVFGDTKREAKSMAEEVQGAISSMLEIDVPMRRGILRSREAMRELMLELRREAENVQTSATVLVPGPFGVLQSRSVSTGEEAKAVKQQLLDGASWLEKQLFMMNIQERLWSKIGDDVEEVTEKEKDRATQQESLNSLLEDELGRRAQLLHSIEEMSGGGALRLAQLEAQNARLEQQLALQIRIARTVVTPQRAGGVAGPVALSQEDVEKALRQGALPSEFGGVGAASAGVGADQLRGFSDAHVREHERIREALEETARAQTAFALTYKNSVMDLSAAVGGGLGDMVASYSAAIPELIKGTASLTSVSGQLIGEFTQQLGKTLIGYGTAGIAIQAFISNPFTAIAAGVGLVALGSALKKSAQQQVSDFTTTGTAAGGAFQNKRFLYFDAGFSQATGSDFGMGATRSDTARSAKTIDLLQRIEKAVLAPKEVTAHFGPKAGEGLYVSLQEEAYHASRRQV